MKLIDKKAVQLKLCKCTKRMLLYVMQIDLCVNYVICVAPPCFIFLYPYQNCTKNFSI